MLICPALRLSLFAQFIIDKTAVIYSRKKIIPVASGFFDLPSGFNLQLASSIEELNTDDWENCVGSKNLFLQRDFLLAFEKNSPANMTFHYAIVTDNKKNSAAFYFQAIHLTADEIAYILEPLAGEVHPMGFGSQVSEWIKKSREEKGFRLLISGNNFISGEHGVGIKKGSDPEKIYNALAETIKVITKNDRAAGKISAILVKDYYEKDAKQSADYLRKKKYHRFMVEPEMIVDVSPKWKLFDDYLGAMSKKYRNRAKSVLKKTESITVRELSEEELEFYKDAIFKLYSNVHEKAKFRLSVLSENYFVAMKKQFPEIFHVNIYELNGKIVGFRSSFNLETHLEAHFIGIDYKANANFPIYQKILYDHVNDGISLGYKKVLLGRTASEIKSTVGAVPYNLVCYIRHRNRFSNQVIRPFIDYLKPSSWIQRNPFKEE